MQQVPLPLAHVTHVELDPYSVPFAPVLQSEVLVQLVVERYSLGLQ